jgi:hypothetical protein
MDIFRVIVKPINNEVVANGRLLKSPLKRIKRKECHRPKGHAFREKKRAGVQYKLGEVNMLKILS